MHNFGHIEIPTTNVKKARKFFDKVFGWTFVDHPEIGHTLFHAGSPPNGSLQRVKKMKKKRARANVYIEVEDIDAKLKEIKKAKGKVLTKKTQVGTMGWRAEFSTPDGCPICLWQTAPKSTLPQQE